jgi:hypothetical protein
MLSKEREKTAFLRNLYSDEVSVFNSSGDTMMWVIGREKYPAKKSVRNA